MEEVQAPELAALCYGMQHVQRHLHSIVRTYVSSTWPIAPRTCPSVVAHTVDVLAA